MDSNHIKTTPKWSKAKEQIWAERFEQLSDTPQVIRFYRKRWFSYAAVAVVLLAVVLPVAAYIYKTKFAPKQEPVIQIKCTPKEVVTPAAMFDFNDAPLEEVILEIEAAYGIRVVRPADMNHRYTGTFSRNRPAEDVLEIVGEPFAITFKIED